MPSAINSKTEILTAEIAKRKIRRMAFEIAENNPDESSLIIAGINGNGEVLAQNLVEELRRIMQYHIEGMTIKLNKKQPLNALIDNNIQLDGQVIIVVDDVSNTGKTLLYAMKPFIAQQPKKIQTLVLVERSHKLFAVQPDYVGLSVSTTLQEHITVETENGKITGAWLH